MVDVINKIPIHVGLFGHIDSGKTAIAEVLSEIISTAGIDAHPQSKARGITIDLGFTSLFLDNYLITLVDGPGHADLIKISASSVEIIDLAMIVIDVNKGAQVQTGEHIIMIESLGIKEVIVILNKMDIFNGDLEKEISKIRKLFGSTSYGSKIPIYAVSAKEKKGFDELKKGLANKIKQLKIQREIDGNAILPIDHHFSIKGRGSIITGTLLKGTIKLNQELNILPINESGKIKSIQIFHQNVSSAKAGDRVGVNLKGVNVKKIYRGCYATDNNDLFDYCDLIEVRVKRNKLFQKDIHFGSQVHITSGMFTTSGYIYPFKALDEKKVQINSIKDQVLFDAFLWLNEKLLIRRQDAIILLSRLDLPPTTLRIIGSSELKKIYKKPPILYKYKFKRGVVQNSDHPQGIICSGLAQSLVGAKRMVGKKLETPFSEVLTTFGTKGWIIVEKDPAVKDKEIQKGEIVIMKELRSFSLKSKKDLNAQT